MDQPISKTKRKKNMHALQVLGEQLVALNPAQLEQLDLSEKLRDAVIEAKKLTKFEARRRQMQYIGRLMREIDAGPLRQKLEKWRGPSQRHQARLHLVEHWRARLIANEAVLTELLQAFPQADVQRMRALVRSARDEAAYGRPPRSFRELFCKLQELIPEPQLDQ